MEPRESRPVIIETGVSNPYSTLDYYIYIFLILYITDILHVKYEHKYMMLNTKIHLYVYYKTEFYLSILGFPALSVHQFGSVLA